MAFHHHQYTLQMKRRPWASPEAFYSLTHREAIQLGWPLVELLVFTQEEQKREHQRRGIHSHNYCFYLKIRPWEYGKRKEKGKSKTEMHWGQKLSGFWEFYSSENCLWPRCHLFFFSPPTLLIVYCDTLTKDKSNWVTLAHKRPAQTKKKKKNTFKGVEVVNIWNHLLTSLSQKAFDQREKIRPPNPVPPLTS